MATQIISSATLNPLHLVPAFFEALNKLNLEEADRLREEYKDILIVEESNKHTQLNGDVLSVGTGWRDDKYLDDVGFLMEALIEALEEAAPPHYYFGASEGDGALFGIWPNVEELEQEVVDGEAIRVDDLDEVPDDYSGAVMLVTDHGNMCRYQAIPGQEPKEVWGVV